MQHPAQSLLDAVSRVNGEAFARIQQAAHEAATSDANLRTPPSVAQQLANNYKKGPLPPDALHGLPVKIDNPRGTLRSGESPDGTQWSNRMAAHYGDIVGTKGADGDAVDIFVGLFPESDKLWVINQRKTWGDRGFDEHKVMAGFHTEAQARAAYMDSYDRGWDGLDSIVPCTYAQLRWWLKHGDTTQSFSLENLPDEGTTIMDKVLWTKDAEPEVPPMHRLMYELHRADAAEGLMLDALTMSDLMGNPDIEGLIVLDALVVQVNRMTIKMDMLKKIMGMAGGDVKPVDVTIADPVRMKGSLQVMVLFSMSDGQTVSIWFHNPDTTPNKLTPMDELVSWKWMLNKKDVTIIVAPERGTELNVREVARRIMRIVERNSQAFARKNSKAAEVATQTETIKAEIATLESELHGLTRKIEIAQMQRDEGPTPKQRWDAARLYVQDLFKKVRTEVGEAALADRAVPGTPAYGDAVELLKGMDTLVFGSGEADGSPEAFRAHADESAIDIRAKLAEAAATKVEPVAAPAPAPAADAPAEPVIASASDAVLSGLGVPAESMAGMSDDGGYAAIAANEALSLKWQDILDSALQQRLVDVRNALRELSWTGTGTVLQKKVGGSVYGITHETKNVGAGSNVVAIDWVINASLRVRDTLAEKAPALAASLDQLATYGRTQEEQVVPTPEPAAQVDTMGVLPEGFTQGPNTIATNPDPITGGIIDKQMGDAGKWFVVFNNEAIPKSEAEFNTRAEAIAAFEAGISEWRKAQEEAAATAADEPILEPTTSPTDEELQAAADAGAEVHQVSRNLADPSLKGQIPLAYFSNEAGTVSIPLWTVKDLGRARALVGEAEQQANFKPFDAARLKMPTAVQLGLAVRAILIVKDAAAASGTPSDDEILPGWSNGHVLDLTQRPTFIQKAFDRYRNRRLVQESAVDKLVAAAKTRTTQIEPTAFYDYEERDLKTKKQVPRHSIVMTGADIGTWVEEKYLAYFWKLYKGCQFYADGEEGSIAVKHHGVLVGIIMPLNAKGGVADLIRRAKRSHAIAAGQTPAQVEEPADEVAEPADIDPVSAVDAAYHFESASADFKLAIAPSLEDADYSAFVTSKTIDQRAKELGLSVSWDVMAMALDGVVNGDADDACPLFDDADGKYLGQEKEAIKATAALIKYFRDFIRSDKELAVDPTSGWARSTMNKAEAQQSLGTLIDIAINRKGDTTLTVSQEDAYADFLHDARVINDYLHKRIRHTGSRNLLRHPKMKALYPDIDNQPMYDSVAALALPYLRSGAALDDTAPPLADVTWPSSWLGFKVVDQAYVDAQSAMLLPSSQQLSGTVYIRLEDNDNGGTPMLVCGRIVGISFTFGKVRYSVAVPIAPQQQVDATLYAVLHDVDSILMLPIEPQPPAAALDAVTEEVGAPLAAIGKASPPTPVFDFAGDVSAAICQLEIALDVVTCNEPINRAEGKIDQADLEARSAEQFRRAIAVLKAGDTSGVFDDAGESDSRYIVGTITKDGTVLGRAVVMDGDGKAMIFKGAAGNERVTYVSPVDGVRRTPSWSDDDAGSMVDWLVENTTPAAAAASEPAPEPAEPTAAGGGEPPEQPPIVPPVEQSEPPMPSLEQGLAALRAIASFMPRDQRRVIEDAMTGEEGQWFINKAVDLSNLIAGMPKTYDQSGVGMKAIAYLHYFKGGGDWYITEKDVGTPDEPGQHQAFGLADLGHGGELGYISIVELVKNGVELDLHWTPQPLDADAKYAEKPEPAEIDMAAKTTAQNADILAALVALGWTPYTDGVLTKTIGGGVAGGMVNPDGDRRLFASIKGPVLAATFGDTTMVSHLISYGRDPNATAAEFDAQVMALDPNAQPAKVEPMNPLQPQGPDRVEWEEAVTSEIERVLAVPRSDAQGIMHASGTTVEQQWSRSADALSTAHLIAGRDTPPDSAAVPDYAGWEREVANLIRDRRGDPDRSAATDIIMAAGNEDKLEALFKQGKTPAEGADAITAPPAVDTSAAVVEGSAEDRAYLQSLIDGSTDMMDSGILEKIEPLFAKYEGNALMMDLLNRAADAYSTAATLAAKQALGG